MILNPANTFFEVRKEGLYCKPGDFYIDAWNPVKTCIVTHAHSDHAKSGHQLTITSENTQEIIRRRMGLESPIHTLPFGKKIKMHECWVSLHPAGHILGSAQIRIEKKGTVSVVSGDYKRVLDPTSEPFELQECDIFVTESTFGLPIYNWDAPEITMKKIFLWWQENRANNLASVLFCYALGKAQRILSLLNNFTKETVYLHGAILSLADLYKERGISLIPFKAIKDKEDADFRGELILAPPLAKGTPWMKRFTPYKTAFASGWMLVRGTRKQKNLDRGFALSDHADWQELLNTIKETKAKTILTTHGNAHVLASYLLENNIHAFPLEGMTLIEEGET